MRINWQRCCALAAIIALYLCPAACTQEPILDSKVPTPPDSATTEMSAPTATIAVVAATNTAATAAVAATEPPASPTETAVPATATITLTSTPIPSPTQTITPTATATLTPTAPIRLVQVFDCPTDGVQISGLDVTDRTVVFTGTASIGNFWYFKFEYKGINEPDWHFVGQVETPVQDGILYTWDASILPPGSYLVNLIVVDKTGNYPPPCQIEIEVLE